MSKEMAIQRAQELLATGLPVTEEEAQVLLLQDQDVLLYVLLELARRAQAGDGSALSPSTPSGMIAPYLKKPVPPKKKKKGKKPGGQPGHKGVSRPPAERIDRTVDCRLDTCPDCGGVLQRCEGEQSTRSRIIEDLPEASQPEVTEYRIHRDYCPHCKKQVEPKVESALPNASLGNRLLALTTWWHYGVGMTMIQIVETLNYHLHFILSKGGLIQKWHQLRLILLMWYDRLAKEVQTAAVLHTDETGWRVNGKTHWLWCFTDAQCEHHLLYD